MSDCQQHPQDQPGPRSCPPQIANCRNRYFLGKFLRPRDFQFEQNYFLSRHRLHNRVLHGWGIACGLEVIAPSDPEWSECAKGCDPCHPPMAIIKPGLALDPCGRELIVEYPLFVPTFEEWLPPETSTQEGLGKEGTKSTPWPDQHDRLLYLYYDEVNIDETAALCADPGGEPEYNFVRETVRIGSIPIEGLNDKHPMCWHDPREAWPTADTCLKPDQSCPQPFVPLAVIKPAVSEERPYVEGEPFPIEPPDMSGRRTIAGPNLTSIKGTNWDHGQHFDLEEKGGQLDIWFSRPLSKLITDDLLPHIFAVSYRKKEEVGEVKVKYENIYVLLQEKSGIQVDPQDRSHVKLCVPRNLFNDLSDATVYVTIECDFLLDWNGVPVDGNLMAARCDGKSESLGWKHGNGTPGGVFKSWFRVPKKAS